MTSFMFKSGIESLEQAIEHFQLFEKNKELKHLRFGLIHLDGAIELILKESLKSKGIHFLRGKGTGWFGVFECLWEIREDIGRKEKKKIFPKELSDILYLNEMELLHELRNSAQHVGVYHSSEQLSELIPKVLQALQAYLKLVFDIEVNQLDKYLKDIDREKEAVELYIEEAEITFNQGNTKWAIVQLYIVLERLFRESLILLNEDIDVSKAIGFRLFDLLRRNDFREIFGPKRTNKILSRFKEIRIIRNAIVHEVEHPYGEDELLICYKELTILIKEMQEMLNEIKNDDKK